MGDKELQDLAWLVADALRIEARAADFDGRGSNAEAILHHRRACTKLSEAAALCPKAHPDKSLLAQHAQDIATRIIYLESIGKAPASLPLEDHVGELALTLDLSVASPPPDQDVAALVAGAGVSGREAPITEEGFQLVAALKNDREMREYVLRVIEGDWRRLQGGAEAQVELDGFVVRARQHCAEHAWSLEALRDELRISAWVEVNLDPDQDKLQLGVALEKEARTYDAQHRRALAQPAYARSIAIFQLVSKYDPRMKNPKVKDMVQGRIAELQDRVKALKEGA